MILDSSILPAVQVSLSQARSKREIAPSIIRFPLQNGTSRGQLKFQTSLLGVREARSLSAGSKEIQENEGRMPSTPRGC